MEGNKLVPKRRYKGYENSKPLKVECLGALTDIKTGPFGSSLHAKDYVDNGIPIITTEHFKEGYLPENKKGVPQVSNEDFLRLNAYKLQRGDIVFSRVGSVDINALTTGIQKGWLFSGRVLRVRPQKKTSSLYLHYLLDTKRVKKDVIARAVGQTMPSINTEILNETRIIKTDNYKEQQKIGNFFKVLDERIVNQARKIAKVKALKAAYLTEMFPQEGETVPKRRFKGFEGEWELKTLNSICSDISDGDWIENEHISDTGKYRIIQTGNLGLGKFLNREGFTKYINQSSFKVLKANEIFPGDILISRLAEPAGRTIIVPNIKKRMVTAVDVTIIRNNDNFDKNFLVTQMNSKDVLNKINENVSGTSHRRISRRNLEKILLIIPRNMHEQQKIGAFFKNIDNQITTEESKLEKLKKMKEAYLEEMFV